MEVADSIKNKAILLAFFGEKILYLGYINVKRERGWGVSVCSLCIKNVESIDHMLVQCDFSMLLSREMRFILRITKNLDSVSLVSSFTYWIDVSLGFKEIL